jgi:hypothetical protein
VFDSGDQWFAHLSLSMQLTLRENGEALYFMMYDERRELAQRSFTLAARALSELLSAAVERMMQDLDEVEQLRAPSPATDTTAPVERSPGDEVGKPEDAEDDGERHPLDEAAEDGSESEGDGRADEVILVPESR